jgi:hypothetical protein
MGLMGTYGTNATDSPWRAIARQRAAAAPDSWILAPPLVILLLLELLVLLRTRAILF